MKTIMILYLTFLTLILNSCSEDSVEPGNGDSGRIKIYITDTPADFDKINIVVDRVEVHKAANGEEGEWIVINNETRTYNLLELRNGASAVLCDTFLSAGHYTQIRLIIGTGSNIVVDGITHELEIPSGLQTGLKLIHEFDIQSDIIYELVLDFEAEKSIVVTGSGKYMLKPTIRVAAVAVSGSISGIVLPADVSTAIWTVSGNDTITTYSDITGAFKFTALHESTYSVYITLSNPAFRDTVITDVSVQAGAVTDIGTVIIYQ
jgi:Domain of unknown function (DUF4382)